MALTDNPMILTITGDVTVGANLDISIPTVETFLLNESFSYSIKQEQNRSMSCTIPSSVSVIKVKLSATLDTTMTLSTAFSYYIQSQNSGLTYINNSLKSGSNTSTICIGVTPNKSYNLTFHAYQGNKFMDIMCNYNVQVSYSQSINETPYSYTDY